MYIIEKPELSEELLEHFGTKGMKWGVRKAAASTKNNVKAGVQKTGPTKKAAIGLAAVATVIAVRNVRLIGYPTQIALGSAVAAGLLARQGQVKLSETR